MHCVSDFSKTCLIRGNAIVGDNSTTNYRQRVSGYPGWPPKTMLRQAFLTIFYLNDNFKYKRVVSLLFLR